LLDTKSYTQELYTLKFNNVNNWLCW